MTAENELSRSCAQVIRNIQAAEQLGAAGAPTLDEVLAEADTWGRNARAALCDLAGATATADRATTAALRALDELTGPLYDIELVEGHEEGDTRHELDTAARALRNVDRIIRLRRALMEES